MNTQQTKQCGQHVYNAQNCHNRIRKVTENRFEKISLLGKHAFDYSVVIENKETHALSQTSFPTRKEATAFFILVKNRHK